MKFQTLIPDLKLWLKELTARILLSCQMKRDMMYGEMKYQCGQLVTDLDQKKQALAVTLCLSGRAREAALEIKAEFGL